METTGRELFPNKAELELEAKALGEIETAGHNLEEIADYRDNMGHQYTPLFEKLEDGEMVTVWDEWIDQFEEARTGHTDTDAFASELAEEMFDLSRSALPIAAYFDYDKWERDLFMGDYWQGSNGYIFRSI